MTKYTTLHTKKTEGKETVFTALVCSDAKQDFDNLPSPNKYDNVMFLGSDNSYGDVFKAWDDEEGDNFFIYFGVKGDEFND